MADAHLALDEAGAFDARPRAQALLLGLGFRVAQLDAPVNSFSGGWRMRLQSGSRIDAAFRRLAARRADQPSRPGRSALARGLPARLPRRAVADLARSRVPGPRGRSRRAHRARNLDAATRATTRRSSSNAPRNGRDNRRNSLGSSARSRTFAASSIASRRTRRKARQAQSRMKALERMELIAPAACRHAVSLRVSRSSEDPQSAPDAGARERGVYAAAGVQRRESAARSRRSRRVAWPERRRQIDIDQSARGHTGNIER